MGSYIHQYYGIPGRGEVVRLMLELGGLPYEDQLVNGKEWRADGAKMKKATKWNVMPVLTLPDGQKAGMSRSILRYLAKIVSVEGEPLYPTDPKAALTCDEVADFIGEDVWSSLLKVVGEKDAAAMAARLMAPGGKVSTQLDELEKNIGGTNSTLRSGKLCMADIYIYAAAGWFVSGFMSKNVNVEVFFRGRPKLRAIVERVGQLPAIRAYYASPHNKVGMNQAYKAAPFARL